jgi:hypothetical protein
MSCGPVDFRAFYLDYDVCGGKACERLRSRALHLLTIHIVFLVMNCMYVKVFSRCIDVTMCGELQ